MGDLQRMRKRFIAAATVLGLISLGLLTYLVLPGSNGPRPAELQEHYLSLKTEVALWQKGNPDAVRADLTQFYAEDIPAKWSEIPKRMDKLIRATGVSAPGIRYSTDSAKAALPGVEQIQIETTVTGDYSKVAQFINSLEQDKVFFIINKVSLGSQEGGMVSLSITVDSFLKKTA